MKGTEENKQSDVDEYFEYLIYGGFLLTSVTMTTTTVTSTTTRMLNESFASTEASDHPSLCQHTSMTSVNQTARNLLRTGMTEKKNAWHDEQENPDLDP